VGFWDLFAKPKVLPAGILKKPIPTTEKNPADGKCLSNKDAMPSACRFCRGARGNGSLKRRLKPPKKLYLR
jgi:hypothetical protein